MNLHPVSCNCLHCAHLHGQIELVELARLALHGDRRDVELYVHRLAYRHRNTPTGDALAGVDMLSGVSLR